MTLRWIGAGDWGLSRLNQYGERARAERAAGRGHRGESPLEYRAHQPGGPVAKDLIDPARLAHRNHILKQRFQLHSVPGDKAAEIGQVIRVEMSALLDCLPADLGNIGRVRDSFTAGGQHQSPLSTYRVEQPIFRNPRQVEHDVEFPRL